jgi:hypothetical protein
MSSKNKKSKGTSSPQDFKRKQGVSKASAWGKKSTKPVELDLPSGEVVLVKRVELPVLLASGAFPDTLMSIVSDKIETATGQQDTPKEVDKELVEETVKDPKKLAELFEAIDKVVPLVVLEPTVVFHKRLVSPDSNEMEIIPDEDRDDEILYTDVVDLEDKMHIFQFAVGGTRDVEEFRTKLESTVADVHAS